MKGRRDLELHSLLLAADERAGVMADQLAESIHYAVAVAIVERLCAGESADSVASDYFGADAFVGGADEAIREMRASLARVAPELRRLIADLRQERACIAELERANKTLTRKLAEAESARANYRGLLKNQGLNPSVFERAIARAERAEAGVARLREALERMDDAASLLCAAVVRRANIYCDESETGELLSARADCVSASHIARAALRGEDPE